MISIDVYKKTDDWTQLAATMVCIAKSAAHRTTNTSSCDSVIEEFDRAIDAASISTNDKVINSRKRIFVVVAIGI